MNDGFVVHEVWSASVLDFLGYPLYRVELQGRDADWYFDAPSLDAQAYLDEYNSPQGLALSNAKTYSLSFARLSKIQHELRRNNQQSWVSEDWKSGKVG